MTLMDILRKKRYGTDKHTQHKYIQEFYELEFLKYKEKNPLRLLEIGVLKGESLKLWRDYFPKADIVGIDIFERVSMDFVEHNVKEYNVNLFRVDSFNTSKPNNCWLPWSTAEYTEIRNNFLEDQKNKGGFDIIIDDGLHSGKAQLNTFMNFYPILNKGGIYIIEDIRPNAADRNLTLSIDNIVIVNSTTEDNLGVIKK